MKKKNTLILLFMFVFTGVTLLAYTPALATMTPCSDAELASHMCVASVQQTLAPCAPENVQVYVIRAVDASGSPATTTTWPFTVGGQTIFRYKAGVTQRAQDLVKSKCLVKPSAWSYIVFNLWTKPLDSDPDGASITLDQVPKNCPANFGNRIAYKLNPSVNFGSKDSIFDLVMPLGIGIDACSSTMATAFITLSDTCIGMPLNVPGRMNAPFEHWVHFSCYDSKINVNVEFDECTANVKNVSCDKGGAECGGSLEAELKLNIVYAYVPSALDPPFPITNMGPATGVVVCTGADSAPVYLRGDKMWWCPTTGYPLPPQ